MLYRKTIFALDRVSQAVHLVHSASSLSLVLPSDHPRNINLFLPCLDTCYPLPETIPASQHLVRYGLELRMTPACLLLTANGYLLQVLDDALMLLISMLSWICCRCW